MKMEALYSQNPYGLPLWRGLETLSCFHLGAWFKVTKCRLWAYSNNVVVYFQRSLWHRRVWEHYEWM